MKGKSSTMTWEQFEHSLRTVFREKFQDAVLDMIKQLDPGVQGVALTQGDGGMDLVSYDFGRVYACYAPPRLRDDWNEREVIRKLRTDFNKVKDKPWLREWIFVHNHPEYALSQKLVNFVQGLRLEVPSLTRLEVWSIQHLWDQLNQANALPLLPLKTFHRRGIGSFRRTLFDTSTVVARDVFVEPRVQLRSSQFADQQFAYQGAFEMMDQWVASEYEGNPSQRVPLVLLGPFGSGKSMLFGAFFDRLEADTAAPIPVAVPLRDLNYSSSAEEAVNELLNRVFRDSPYDPADERFRYCLLCDGFDEMNLYYHDDPKWVQKAFRGLRRLMVDYPNIIVAVSSRPILLWDSQAHNDLGPVKDLFLEPFDDERIGLWCVNNRKLPGRTESALGLSFLISRQLLEVARNPLVLFMIAEMLHAKPDLFAEDRRYRLAEIYGQFMDWTAAHGAFHQDQPKHRLPENYRDVLKAIAWHAFTSGSDLMSQRRLLIHLQKAFGPQIGDIPVDPHLLNAHMLQPVRSSAAPAAGTRQEYLIEFTHQSFREYLTAEHLWCELNSLAMDGVSGSEAWPRWRLLAQCMPGRSELEFLRDLIALAPEDSCERLYRICDPWMSPADAALLACRQACQEGMALERESLSRTTIFVAATAFFVCANLWKRLTSPMDISERQRPDLVPLLRWGSAFAIGDDGPPQVLEPLLACLRELPLDGLKLVRHDLSETDFSNSSLYRAHFHQCTLNGMTLVNVQADQAHFEHCIMWFRDLRGASFHEASFADSRWEFLDEIELSGGDFTGADFSRTVFVDPFLEGATFARNCWSKTRIECRVRSNVLWQLRHCELDLEAWQFFTENHVKLLDCTLLPSPLQDGSPRGWPLAPSANLPTTHGPSVILLVNQRCSELPGNILDRHPYLEPLIRVVQLNAENAHAVLARACDKTGLLAPMLILFPTQESDEAKHPLLAAWRAASSLSMAQPYSGSKFAPPLRLVALHLPGASEQDRRDVQAANLGDCLDFTLPSGRPWSALANVLEHWFNDISRFSAP